MMTMRITFLSALCLAMALVARAGLNIPGNTPIKITSQTNAQPTSPSTIPFFSAPAASNVFWGDSLTVGYGQMNFPMVIQSLTGTPSVNFGVGGMGSEWIAASFLSNSAWWGFPTVIWSGRNGSQNALTNDIMSMVKKLQTTNYVVLGIITATNEPVGTANYIRFTNANRELKQVFGSHFVETREMLRSHYNPALIADVTAFNGDTIPPSLTIDGLHLNSEGYALIAEAVLKSPWMGLNSSVMSSGAVLADVERVMHNGTTLNLQGNATMQNATVGNQIFFLDNTGPFIMGTPSREIQVSGGLYILSGDLHIQPQSQIRLMNAPYFVQFGPNMFTNGWQANGEFWVTGNVLAQQNQQINGNLTVQGQSSLGTASASGINTGTLTNNGLTWLAGVSNNTAPNGSILTTADGNFYVRSNATWIRK